MTASASSGSPFWRFSLRFYRQDGVADACILLQEEAGVDVNLLLFLLWHARRKRTLSASEIAELERRIAPWREMTVIPLRTMRRALKSPPTLVDGATSELFRTRIKAIELEAERLQQWERRRRRSRRPREPISKPMPPRAVGLFLLPQPKPCSRRLPAQSATRRNDMDKDTYDRGLTMRRKVLGEEYVDRALKSADDFNRDFQRIVTQYCWGETWGDDTLSPRERSILNLGMIAALGKMEEFQTHVRGALRNGLTPNEIRAVLTQIAIYCGIPVGVDCFRIAKTVLGEAKAR